MITSPRISRRHLLAALAGLTLLRGAGWPAAARADAVLPQPLSPDATIAFTGHSMLAAIFPNDDHAYNDGVDFPTLWPGATHFDFAGFSSNASRWRSMGYARTGSYDRLVMTELGDLKTGLPHPASAEGRHNLQHLYWFAMTAIEKGASPVLYLPWSPLEPDLDHQGQEVFHYQRQWLEQHIDQPVWIIPAGLFARAARDHYDDDGALFVDAVHWRPNGPGPTGLAYLTYQFFARTRVPQPTLFPEMEDLAWRVLQTYRWAGFGGSEAVPALEIEDPLPDPAPLPPMPAVPVNRP